LYGRAGRLTVKNGGFRRGQTGGDVAAVVRLLDASVTHQQRQQRLQQLLEAGAGLGRIVALDYRSPTSYQIHEHIR
jgi:hypothetical protein